MWLSKMVKRRETAFSNGAFYCDNLLNELKMHREFVAGGTENVEKYVGLDPVDLCDKLFCSENYKKYVEFSLMGKYYQRMVVLVTLIYIAIHALLCAGIYLFCTRVINSEILAILLIGILTVILTFIFVRNSKENYDKYYDRTMYGMLYGIYDKFKFSTSKSALERQKIINILPSDYSSRTSKNRTDFSSNAVNGSFCDLKLEKITKIKDKKSGVYVQHKSTIFDGFFIELNSARNFGNLKGNVIKIKDDENAFSTLTEDTVKGIYESKLEFNFNTEELNKALDCKLSGFSGFLDADAALMEVNKIITPSFEQHLRYLRNRYNSFNMNFGDNGLVLSFNMKRSSFQKMKHGELLDFKTTYREANLSVGRISGDLFGYQDFAYHRLFPIAEQLYLVHYLLYIYNSSMSFDYYHEINSSAITSFENKMERIYNMGNGEFKKIRIEELKKINENYKLNLNSLINERRG